MKAVVSGGGTAGHINPALALASELEDRGWQVFFAGNPTGIEARLASQAGLAFVPFASAGFDRAKPLTLFSSYIKVRKSAREARAWLSNEDVDAVVGFGGYVELPVGYAAEKLRIPLIVHEQNSVPGVANKSLSRHADAVALTYGSARGYLSPRRLAHVEVTGNPVRRSVITASRAEGRSFLEIPDDMTLLLVFGGSLGARHLNQVLCSLKDELLARDDLYIVHVTGPKEYDSVVGQLALTEGQALRWKVMSYCDRMGDVLAACDLTVSRAGATSLAEITALGIPAVLVPYPYARADHQTKNAQSLVNAGAALMVADDVIDAELRPALMLLLDDVGLRARMRRASTMLRGGDAGKRLADLVERTVEEKRERQARR